MKKLISTFFFLLTLTLTLHAQSGATFALFGTLYDINGDVVAGKSVQTQLTFLDHQEKEIKRLETVVATSDEGVFTVLLNPAPEGLTSASKEEIVDLEIVLIPSKEDTWLEEGRFSVKYHLKQSAEDDPLYDITRYEGQELIRVTNANIQAFQDVYPFGYLSCEFVFSFSDALTDTESIRTEKSNLWIEAGMKGAPQAEPAPPASRGLKGGYAVGGYKSKKK